MKIAYLTTIDITISEAAKPFPEEEFARSLRDCLDNATNRSFTDVIGELDDKHGDVVAGLHRWTSIVRHTPYPDEEEPSGDDEVSAADRTASLTQKIASLEASLALCERRAEDAEARNVFLETEIVALAEKAKR